MMIQMRRHSKKWQGQSLTEYSLVMSLIAVVCIGGLVALGNGLIGALNNLNTSMEPDKQKSTSIAIAQNPESAQDPNPIPVQGIAPPQNTCVGTLCGNQIQAAAQIEVYDPTQVAGANGIDIVDQYANTITQIVKQLDNDPNADPSLRDMLTQLAKNGHSIAQSERFILKMKGGGYTTFPEPTKYEAQKTKVFDYLTQNPNALSPELMATVQVAANNISAQAVDFTGSSDGEIILGTSNFNQANVNQKFVETATAIRGESNTICKSGGDTSECVRR